MAKRFRFPVDATSMTDAVRRALPKDSPAHVVVNLLGRHFGDRDRALEDYLNTPTATGGIPFSFDDGIFTYVIDDSSNTFIFSFTEDGFPTKQAYLQFLGGGGGGGSPHGPTGAILYGRDYVQILSDNDGGQVQLLAAAPTAEFAEVRVDAASGTAEAFVRSGKATTVEAGAAGAAGNLDLLVSGSGSVNVGSGGPTRKIGFYGVAGITQPAHPVTLADVINALTALGLTA